MLHPPFVCPLLFLLKTRLPLNCLVMFSVVTPAAAVFLIQLVSPMMAVKKRRGKSVGSIHQRNNLYANQLPNPKFCNCWGSKHRSMFSAEHKISRLTFLWLRSSKMFQRNFLGSALIRDVVVLPANVGLLIILSNAVKTAKKKNIVFLAPAHRKQVPSRTCFGKKKRGRMK